jgi:predicted regulator of amino acid metabolism with ACT domain
VPIVLGMRLLRVLLCLPDRPGSLGQVTTLLGRLGIDIQQVRVLARDGVVATDEFIVTVAGPVVEGCLVDLLEEIDGVRVLGTWPLPATDALVPSVAELAKVTD